LPGGSRRRRRGGFWAGVTSTSVISTGVAVLYAGLGLITLGLAQMSGLASPVWPAAGVAFAAALHWGWRALPGVFLGSAGLNAYWLTRFDEPEPRSLLVAAAIGLGAVLGAAAGAALVHRYVGPVRRLDTPRSVVLTLALGGLLATAIAPTVGVAAQLAAGLLSLNQAAFGWLTWWVGDAIGVIVWAPLMFMVLPSQAPYWSGRRWKIAVPSLLIFGIIVSAVVQNVAQDRTRMADAVDQLGDLAATDLGRNIALHQEVLEGLHGLVDASGDLSAKEFDAYTSGLLARFPNLQALSWNPLVAEADLAAFQARQRAQPGLQNFTVTERDANGDLRPVSPRPEYVVVAYIEPIETNRNALGFDINSNPARAAAIEAARNTGRPTATSPIDLVQESGKQKGMLALLPVYRDGSDPGPGSVPGTELRGFAVGVYRLGDLLTETFRGRAWDSVDVTLVDVSDRANPVVIADLPARQPATPEQIGAGPTATTAPLDVYGRTWALTVRPTSAEFTDNHRGLLVILLLAALAVTLLLEAFLLILSGMESLARRLMSELRSAADYVTSILPNDLDGAVPVTSRFIPSEELGGDSFDHRWIDDDHLIAHVIDVCGHGIAPAMFSISVHNLLRSGTLDHDTLQDPGLVLAELNRLFQMDQQAGNYFTIWYCVYQPSTRILRYSGAGHPPAIIVTGDGSDPVQLRSEAVPVGVLRNTTFETRSYTMPPGADLLIYSDGAYELALPDGRRWEIEEFIDLCARTARSPQWALEDIVAQLRNRSDTGTFDDDCTLVRLSVS
jgi:CHASE1-domain containing sensor protein